MQVQAAPSFPRGIELSPARCESQGRLVIDVVQKVINDVDSGEAGNYWAFDSYTRRVRVWAKANGYCAIVDYDGKFDAQASQTSPGGGGALDGDEDGTFRGGYRATITGTLLSNPAWTTRGSVGTFDYQCDIGGTCPGRLSRVAQYFEAGNSFTYAWWGWIYRAGGHGKWTNSVDGISGDIQ